MAFFWSILHMLNLSRLQTPDSRSIAHTGVRGRCRSISSLVIERTVSHGYTEQFRLGQFIQHSISIPFELSFHLSSSLAIYLYLSIYLSHFYLCHLGPFQSYSQVSSAQPFQDPDNRPIWGRPNLHSRRLLFRLQSRRVPCPWTPCFRYVHRPESK